MASEIHSHYRALTVSATRLRSNAIFRGRESAQTRDRSPWQLQGAASRARLEGLQKLHSLSETLTFEVVSADRPRST